MEIMEIMETMETMETMEIIEMQMEIIENLDGDKVIIDVE